MLPVIALAKLPLPSNSSYFNLYLFLSQAQPILSQLTIDPIISILSFSACVSYSEVVLSTFLSLQEVLIVHLISLAQQLTFSLLLLLGYQQVTELSFEKSVMKLAELVLLML